jgi:hypothetical protein
MTSALEGGEWSAARRTLPPGKTRYPVYRRLGGPQGRSGRVENLVPPGFDLRTVKLVVSRYTDWATRPTLLTSTLKNYGGKLRNWPNGISGPVSYTVSIKRERFPVQLKDHSFSVSTCDMESLKLLASYLSFIVTKCSHFKVLLQLPFTWRKACKNYFNTLRTGLLNCLNARSRSLNFRHRASCI